MTAKLFGDLERFGQATALIRADGSTISYVELARLADDKARSLGPAPSLVLMEGANAVDPIAFYIGALRSGHAVVLSGGGDAMARIAQGFAPSHVYARTAGGDWAIAPGAGRGAGLGIHPDLAVLLSTSGSTGSSKLIRLSHANLLSNAEAIARYLRLAPGERAITSLPPYYSYGLSVLHSHLLFGHTVVLSEHSVADDAFWQQVDREGVTSVAGVPHSYELLTRSGFLERTHPSLRYLTQAGGKLPVERVQSFARWADANGKRFYVMYGQTEAGPRMAYLPPEDAAAHADCIGRPVPGGSFRLAPLDCDGGGGLSEGAGELVYRGPNVMMGYAASPADLALPQGPDELSTGDIAVLGDHSYYRVVGRMSRFAKLFGLRIGFDDIEQRLAAIGVEAAVTGDDTGLVIAITGCGDAMRIVDSLSHMMGLPTTLIAVVEVDALPRLPSGKTDYVRVRAMRPAVAQPEGSSLATQIGAALGRPVVDDRDSFVSLGGDSLNYVHVSMLVDDHLGYLPDRWETLPIGELQVMTPATSDRIARLDSSIFVRALAILLVLFHHASQIAIGGSADALLAVAGFNFGRFSAPRIVRGELSAVLTMQFWKVVVPYFTMLTLLFAYVRQVFWPQYLLFSNMTLGFFVDGERKMKIFWFMEAYLLLFLICALLLGVPAVRRLGKANPWRLALTACIVAAAIRVAALTMTDIPLFYAKAPTALAWLFTLGWLIHLADTRTRKRVALAVAAANITVAVAVAGPSADQLVFSGTLGIAVLVLLFVPQVPVGKIVAAPFSAFAAASLYIYIAQPIVLQPIYHFYPDGAPLLRSIPVVIACLMVGIVLWQLVSLLERIVVHAWHGHWSEAAAVIRIGRNRG